MAAPIRFLSGRNQQQKIGIEGSTENQKVLEVVGRVGIGTTIFEPSEQLDVQGSANIRDNIKVSTINATTIVTTGTGNTFSDLNVTGVATFAGAADFNNNVDIDGQTELDDLNVTGIATFTNTLKNTDKTELTNLNVSGVSTFSSIVNVNSNLVVSNNTELNNLSLSGVSTFTGAADFNGSIDVDGHTELDDVNISGVSTFAGAADFNGSIDVDGHTELDNVNVSGISTFGNTIDANGRIVGAATSNVIPFLYSNLTDLPSAATYHGAFAHVHSTGKAYYAHAGNWIELVNKEVNGTVGTGTERYNIGHVDLTTLNVSGVSTFAGAIDANGNLDVDGNTELDDVNVSGVSTFTGNIDANAHTELTDLNVSGVTTTSGILDINAGAQANTLKVEDLTDNRVVIAGTGGELEDDGNLTFNGVQLAVGVNLDVNGHTELGTVNVSSASTFSGVINANGNLDVNGQTELDTVNVSSASTFAGIIDANGGLDVSGHTELDNVNVSGAITATTFTGNLTGNAGGNAATATKLQTPRTFQLTGDVVAPPISFDGTSNVSLAATIQPNSVGLGTNTFGDYVKTISGTGNQITVTSGTGEGSTPVISIPDNPTLPGTTVSVANDLQVNRNLNVSGNITIGGTTAFVDVQRLRITDADIVLGYRTDSNNKDVSNDTTASHGGVAVASTEGSPLISLIGAGETLPATYKKIMWFKSGAFTGLATDAWLTNYAFGVGTTSMSAGTKFAVGNIETDFDDIKSVRHINSSGIVTSTGGFFGNLTGTASTASFATTAVTAQIALTLNGTDESQLNVASATTATNLTGGDSGDIPYQSSSGITTFVDASSALPNQVLLWTGSSPVWSNVTSGSGSFSGISIQDEGSIVGTGGSIATINFVGSNIVAAAVPGANGIATVTMSNSPTFSDLTITGITSTQNLNVVGLSTFNDVHVGSAITMFASTGIISATSFFGSGGDLQDLILGKIEGLRIENNSVQVGTGFTYASLNFIGNNITATGIGTTANISVSDTPTFDTVTVTNDITANGNIVGDNSTNITGINQVTANTFSGNATSATTATNVTVTANNSANETVYPVFVDGATGSQGAETDTGLSYNPSTGALSASSFVGSFTGTVNTAAQTNITSLGTLTSLTVSGDITANGNIVGDNSTNITGINQVNATTFVGALSGNATSATTATTATTATNFNVTSNNVTNENVYPIFVDGTTGSQGAETDSALSYNPSTNVFTAGTFSGSGAYLSALNASNLGSGTVPDARFPGTLPAISGANLTSLTAANLTGTLPAISGVNLTSLNASNLGSGTVPDARFPATLPSISGANLTSLNGSNISSGTIAAARVATLNQDTTGTASLINITSNNGTNENVYPVFVDGFSGSQGGETDTDLSYNPSTNTFTAGTFSGALSGNGSAVTNLNASNLSTGTVPSARMSGTYNIESATFTVQANNSANETVYPVFVDGATGAQGAETDTGLSYNPSTGLFTAVSYAGDGSALTGIVAGITPTENTIDQAQPIPFFVGTAQTSIAGISTGKFVFNPSNTRLGIGVTNPESTLSVETNRGDTIQYVGGTSQGGSNTMTLSGIAAGDLIIFLSCADSNIPSLSGGFTAIPGLPTQPNTSSSSPYSAAMYKIATGASETVTSLSTQCGNALFAFRGVDSSNPFDVNAVEVITSGTNPNPPQITTVSDNSMIVAVGFLDDQQVAGSVTVQSGYTLAVAEDAPNQATLMASYKAQAEAGSEDPGAFVVGVSDSYHAQTYALRANVDSVVKNTFSFGGTGIEVASKDFVISSSQQVGIKTDEPDADLHVNGSLKVKDTIPNSLPDDSPHFLINKTNEVSPVLSVSNTEVLITAGSTITGSLNVTGGISGDGSGLTKIAPEFYTGITSSNYLAPTSFETTVFTFPSTTGKQYIIESINVANIDASVGVGTTVNIIASIQDATAAEQTYIAYNVPIANGGALELIKNPIVAGPSDVIKMWTTNPSYVGITTAAEVYMNFTEFTSSEYVSKFASSTTINTTDPVILYTSTGNPTMFERIGFANRTDTGDYPVSIRVTSGLVTTYLVKDLVIPRYSVVDILDRSKRIETNAKLEVEVGSTNTIDVIVSGKKIS